MKPDFKIGQGDLPKISDTLEDDGGPVDLTGCTVLFTMQGAGVSYSRAGTILQSSPTVNKGQVQYVLAAGLSDLPGIYRAQWTVTDGSGNTRLFPTGSLDDDDENGRYIVFEIVPRLPLLPVPGNIMLISDTYELVRALLGDFDPAFRKHEDTAIASVVRTIIRIGRLPGYAVTADNRSISPVITSPRDLGVLAHRAALMFVGPDSSDYSYKTRALSERFGDQRTFLFRLENELNDLQNDGGVFTSFQSFYGWVNALTGLNIWSVLSDMHVRAPVASVTIGRAGIIVNTT